MRIYSNPRVIFVPSSEFLRLSDLFKDNYNALAMYLTCGCCGICYHNVQLFQAVQDVEVLKFYIVYIVGIFVIILLCFNCFNTMWNDFIRLFIRNVIKLS